MKQQPIWSTHDIRKHFTHSSIHGIRTVSEPAEVRCQITRMLKLTATLKIERGETLTCVQGPSSILNDFFLIRDVVILVHCR